MSEPHEPDGGVQDARKLFAGPCTFVAGASAVTNLPAVTLPEVAFVGRSNVGKSSLINALTNRAGLARVSRTPGRTREINFFRLGDRLTLVDLPGYGYAKASRALSQSWQDLIFAYLRGRPSLRRVLLLIDARRGIMENDRATMKLLDRAAASYVLVLTKTDELSRADLAAAMQTVQAEAKRFTASFPEVLAVSAHRHVGLDSLKTHIAALCGSLGS